MKVLLIAVTLTTLLGAAAHAESPKPTKPADGTPEAVILDGLKLILDGKFDDWIAKHCSKTKACSSVAGSSSLKRYNLPALQRRAKNCLKDNGVSLQVVRSEDESATERKVFIQCEEVAMPMPFHMINEGGAWKFASL